MKHMKRKWLLALMAAGAAGLIGQMNQISIMADESEEEPLEENVQFQSLEDPSDPSPAIADTGESSEVFCDTQMDYTSSEGDSLSSLKTMNDTLIRDDKALSTLVAPVTTVMSTSLSQDTSAEVTVLNSPEAINETSSSYVLLEVTQGTVKNNISVSGLSALSVQAEASGKNLGLIHRARKKEAEDAQLEAGIFYSAVKETAGKAVYILDADNIGNEGTVWVRDFLDHFYLLSGIKPIVWCQNNRDNYDWQIVTGDKNDYSLWWDYANGYTYNGGQNQWNQWKQKSGNGAGEMTAVLRLYNSLSGEHLYSSDLNEKKVLTSRYKEWVYEGIAWFCGSNGTGIHRLYNYVNGDHLLTADLNEIKVLTARYNWKDEGITGYSAGSDAVYRLYNQAFVRGSHLYTVDKNEYNILPKYDWAQESRAYYCTAKTTSQKESEYTRKEGNKIIYFSSNGVKIKEESITQNILSGLDISKWQSNLNLNNIDYDFVIIQSSHAKDAQDPYFESFMKTALASGKLVGFYHAARTAAPGEEMGTAVEEATNFYNTVKKYIGIGVPALDWEFEMSLGTGWAKEFLDTFYKLSGVKPLIYTSSYYTRYYDWTDVAKAGYKLWVADWNKGEAVYGHQTELSYPGIAAGIGAFKEVTIHQYTAYGHLPGFNGNLDLDIFYGTASDWKKLASKS